MERPILFSGPMVQAILAGRKTMTRRIVKKQAALDALAVFGPSMLSKLGCADLCPYGVPGDTLWVREAHRFTATGDKVGPQKFGPVFFEASQRWFMGQNDNKGRLRPSIHMPRWASRITLRITETRVERLHAISDADCDAEVFGGDFPHRVLPHLFPDAETAGRLSLPECFARLWNSINGADAWDANPWVWVVRFEQITGDK